MDLDMNTAPAPTIATTTAATDRNQAAAAPRITLQSRGFSIDHPIRNVETSPPPGPTKNICCLIGRHPLSRETAQRFVAFLLYSRVQLITGYRRFRLRDASTDEKRARYNDGVVPCTALNARWKESTEPNPLRSAIRLSGHPDRSRRSRVHSTRMRATNCAGVVPISFANRRMKLRSLMPARAAMSATRIGSSKCSAVHCRTPLSRGDTVACAASLGSDR